MPSRTDIDPLDMASFLPRVILIDVDQVPDLDFRFRLVGTYYSAFWSSDPTGKALRDIPGQGPGSILWSALAEVTETGAPMTTTIPYIGPKKELYDVEDCVMPLAADRRTVDMIMVTCDYMPKDRA